jgi:hypothetical protein
MHRPPPKGGPIVTVAFIIGRAARRIEQAAKAGKCNEFEKIAQAD